MHQPKGLKIVVHNEWYLLFASKLLKSFEVTWSLFGAALLAVCRGPVNTSISSMVHALGKKNFEKTH